MVLAVVITTFAMFLGFTIIPCVRQYLPHTARITLAAAMSCVVVGKATAGIATITSLCSSIIILANCVICAIPIAFACESLVLAGRLIDTARGAQFSEQVVPGVGRVSILEGAGRFIALLWIMVVDFEIFITSFLDAASATRVTNTTTLFQLIGAFSESFYAGLFIAAPLLALSFILDTSGMLVAKVLPRFPVAFELLPVKLLLILFCLAVRLLGEPSCLISLRSNTLRLLEVI